MREHKYRGLTEKGEWVYGSYVKDRKHHYIFPDKRQGRFIENFIKIRPETIGEDTGLKDKNGRKIHEEDIVNLKHGEAGQWHTKLVITWAQFRFYAKESWSKQFGYTLDATEIEIIGNIHENPELLER